jgi:hypothetical protein
MISLILILLSYYRTPRYFSVGLTYAAGVYQCKITYGINSFTLFGSLINISILCERLSNFEPFLKTYFQNKPYLVSFIAFCISVSVHMITFFIADARADHEFKEAFQNNEKAIHFPFCKRVSFVNTIYGQIILMLISFLRDILFLTVEIT